jgi:hypothetical protein
MADCTLLAKCIFFNDKMASMPTTSHLLKKKYCQGDNSTCARFMVFSALGREQVPPTLYPNDGAQAHKILETAKKP